MKCKIWPAVLLLLAVGLSNCRDKKEAARVSMDPVPVSVTRIVKKTVQEELALSGNIEGDKTVKLGFMVAGKINYIVPEEGQKIARGQLVASLDPESYAIAKELADIQVMQVEDEYMRLKGMHDTRSISDGDFAKISFGLQQARLQQKLHTKNLAETKLYSPISGVVLKKLAETGEITGTGIPVIVISDISKVKASVFIPESELHLVSTGQEALVNVTSSDSVFKGKVTEVGSLADPAARAFTVRIELPNPAWIIRPGMIAEVTLSTGRMNEVIEVPVGVVVRDFNNLSYVFVVDETTGKAFKRPVSLGKLRDDQVGILSGIVENELLVTGGQQKLNDGTPVNVQNENP